MVYSYFFVAHGWPTSLREKALEETPPDFRRRICGTIPSHNLSALHVRDKTYVLYRQSGRFFGYQVRLCNRKTPMSSDDSTQPGSQMGFAAVDTISANDNPPCEIISCILQHEEAGIPLVVRGLDTDPNWSPLPRLDPSEEEENLGRQSPGRQINRSLNLDGLNRLIPQLVSHVKGTWLPRNTLSNGSINFHWFQRTYCSTIRKKYLSWYLDAMRV